MARLDSILAMVLQLGANELRLTRAEEVCRAT